MQKMQSSFRITLLLYLLVLILPFSFYFTYTSFQTMQNDTKAVRLVSWTAGAIEHLAIRPSDKDNKQMVIDVNKNLQHISDWVMKNDDSELYIGATKLSKDFSNVQTCWNAYIENLSGINENAIKQHSLQCYDLTENLAIIIEKMVYLKQNKIINLFYLTLALITIFALIIIYLMRVYIHQQIKKHAIHDHDTKLFNKKYFCAELKTSCARAERNNAPLSLLSILIDDFEKENKRYDKQTKKRILNTLGELITALTRTSDVACRYDENHFSILLPDTPEENALILEKRVREAFEKHDFGVIPELHFKFGTAHLNYKESAEAFRTRTEGLLE